MSNDSWRPKLHLAPQNGSISDPNGLCQFRGTYHVFCQNAPEYPGNLDSPHGWGHFASRDLVSWVFLGCHVMPDAPSDRDGSYSGGAYVTQDGEELWLYYTGNVREPEGDGTYAGRLANQTRMRSYNGINLGPKEVVLDNAGYPAYCSNHVRDPKVWLQDGTLHMMLGARTRTDSRGSILMYDSPDGERWGLSGSLTNQGPAFGYMWECPDRIVLGSGEGAREFLACCPQGTDNYAHKCQNVHSAGYFPIEGTICDLMREDTLLMGASAPHATDQAGVSADGFVEWDHGFDYYACQTLVDEQGRTILVGWMSLPHDKNDVRPYDNPTDSWRGCLTVPRVLSLDERSGRILQQPAAEIDSLRGERLPIEGEGPCAEDGRHPGEGARGEAQRRKVTIYGKVGDVLLGGVSGNGVVRFDDFLELRIADGVAELAFTDDSVGQGRTVRQALCGEVHDLRILVDTSVLEIFLNGGETVFGTRYYAETDALTLCATFGRIGEAAAWSMRPLSVNYLVTR